MLTMEEVEYKKLQELSVRNNNGTSITEAALAVTSPALFLFFSNFIVSIYIQSSKIKPVQCPWTIYFIEFVLIVFPLILSYTTFANSVTQFLSLFFVFFILSLISSRKNLNKKRKIVKESHRLLFISYFKAFVNLITCICILAVDFQVFPRRFGKTEAYGFGLMDTGVGYFVVSNAVVVKPKVVHQSFIKRLSKTCLGSLPLLALGLIRFITVKGLDYQSNVTEYGVHWNFFITLATVKVFSSLILPLCSKYYLETGVLISVVYQLILCLGLEDWALSDLDRNENFIYANREGILSIPGYLSLFFIGLAIGKLVQESLDTVDDYIKKTKTVLLYCLGVMFLTYLSNYFFKSSRRFTNVTYVCWMTFMNLYVITWGLVIELSTLVSFNFNKKVAYVCSNLVDAINYNALIFFLLSNLLTGIVNLSFRTLLMNDVQAVGILTVYMFVSTLVMHVLYKYKIKLKFW